MERHRVIRPLIALVAAIGALVGTTQPAAAFGSMDVTKAVVSTSSTTGLAPLVVAFDGTQSYCVESCSLTGYSWSFGDGTTATGATASHSYGRGGSYTASLTVTASNATSHTAYVIINVSDDTRAIIAASPTVAQIPFAATFDGSGSTVGWHTSIVSYQWTFGDGTTATGPVVSHTYTTPGIRQVVLTVVDGTGYAQSNGVYVFAQDALAAAVNLSASSPTKGSVTLSWTNRTQLLERNHVERCTGGSCTTFTTIFGAFGSDTRFSESGLKSGSTLTYRIRSVDYLGRTVVSAPVKVKVR